MEDNTDQIVLLFTKLESLKYQIYARTNELNIIGIRRELKKVNLFNDFIFVVYREHQSNGGWKLKRYKATTKPGLVYLLKPLNVKGTAILAPGQYIDTYSVDWHRGKYKAICQRLKSVQVFRDNNKDSVIDLDPKTTQTGNFGINIHRASQLKILNYVNGNSAGCQVINNIKEFDELMKLAYQQVQLYGNKFTYTLLNETEFSDSQKSILFN